MAIDHTNPNRKEMIQELQILADKVLELKKSHRQKRPIVIEFSGSPKSGKTSCINSLELFLKRNGFSVEIVQERASVCPVEDKHSPLFNIWTVSSSITGMVGVLARKNINCDVLILDRGIFDAFCWFNWLLSKNKLDKKQSEAIETFLFTVMDLFMNRVDIVFAFTVNPDISIEREFAILLTDKPGAIMNQKVLGEYLKSVNDTKHDKSRYFHTVFDIDTSNINQDQVGKKVTDITLKTLYDLLVEKIGYFEITNTLQYKLNKKRIFEYSELSEELIDIKFDLRDKVEKAKNFLQPVPIVVITNKSHDKVLTIRKNPKATSENSPEKNKLLCYVGGHPRLEDLTDASSHDFLTICKYALQREVWEEIGISSLVLSEVQPFFIYTPDTEKSKQHIGVCFLVEMDTDSLKMNLDPHELVLNKGTSKSGRFQDVNTLNYLENEFESWSIEILSSCFKKGKQQRLNMETTT
jgi:predicted NUDIX family phosphoesterase